MGILESTDPSVIEFLLYGRVVRPDGQVSSKLWRWQDNSGLHPVSVGQLSEVWAELRDELLPAWIEDNPGTRPYAWWECEAPEPRRDGESGYFYLTRHGLILPSEQRKRPGGSIRPKEITDDGRRRLWRFIDDVERGSQPSEADLVALASAFKYILRSKNPKEPPKKNPRAALGIAGEQSEGRKIRDGEAVLEVEFRPALKVERLRAHHNFTLEKAIQQTSNDLDIPEETLSRYHKKHRREAKSSAEMEVAAAKIAKRDEKRVEDHLKKVERETAEWRELIDSQADELIRKIEKESQD